MRSPLASVATAALLLGACSYDFSNPAEKLDAGEVTGRVVADTSGTGTLGPVSGVTVEVKGSANSQSSRGNGSFFLLGLEEGRHTLLFTKATGEGNNWSLQRDIELGFGSDGQLEGVILGDLRLRYSVALSGTFSVPFTSGCGDFTGPPTGYAIDEVTGAVATVVPLTESRSCWDGFSYASVTEYTGGFTYTIPVAPVGPHRIRFAITAGSGLQYGGVWVGGPLAQNIPESSEGQSLTLAEATLRTPDTFNPGRLRFRVVAAPGSPAPSVNVYDVRADTTYNPTPDSSGWVDESLTEGVYQVWIDVGGALGFDVPSSVNAVVVANQVTELGELAVVDANKVNEGQFACLKTADCLDPVMYSCSNGSCVFHEPAQPALCATGPQIDSECSATMNGCVSTPPSANAPCNGGLGVCGQTPGFTYVCIPNGAPDCRFDIYVVPKPNCTTGV